MGEGQHAAVIAHLKEEITRIENGETAPGQPIMITNRHSFERPGGGYDTCELVYQAGTPPEAINAALVQWNETRQAILNIAAGVSGGEASYIPPEEVRLAFGKFEGYTLLELYQECDFDGNPLVDKNGNAVKEGVGRGYVAWLAQETKDPTVRQAAKKLLANPPSRNNEQLPF
jgi:hypothetical protein